MTPEFKSASGRPASSFAFGTMQFGGASDAAESAAVFEQSRAAGINLFDCAFAYTNGAAEEILGRLMAPDRDDLFITTKGAFPGGSGRDHILQQFDTSRQQLDTDFVDLYFLHRWDDETPLEETFEALATLHETGLIRHIGVSNFSAWQCMKAQGVASRMGLKIAVLQPMYNLVKRQAEVEILPMAASEGMAVMPYSPLGGGLLTGKYQTGATGRIRSNPEYAARYAPDWMMQAATDLGALAAEVGVSPITLAVAWVAYHPAITFPIISGRNPVQLAPSLAAVNYELDGALYARLSALTPTPPPATDRLEEVR